jgi:hypothetical protein
MNYSSKVVIGAEYGQKFGIKDIDNRVIASFRQINILLENFVLPRNLRFLANFVPNCIRIPQFVLDIANSKF